MKNTILSKILNKDGTLVWKFSRADLVQKYFTKEELDFLQMCFGDTLSEKYYCLAHNITCAPLCKCGNKLKFNSFKSGYQNYCSNTCTLKYRDYKDEWKEKRAKTNLERYGNTCTFSLVDENKRKQSLTEKYGGPSPMCSTEVRQNRKKPESYDNNYNHSEANKKREETCLKKYGVKNINQTKENKEKHKNELLKNNFNLNSHKKYIYKNESFDSSWELAFYIKNIDDGVDIKRNHSAYFKFFDKKGKVHYYFPDFIINGAFVEIKGDYLTKNPYNGENFWVYKEAIIKANNIKLYFQKDIKPYIDYVRNKYGKNFLKQFKKDKNSKRKIIEIENEDDIKSLFEKRNSNIKIKYNCSNCGVTELHSVRTVLHFNNLLCRKCRALQFSDTN